MIINDHLTSIAIILHEGEIIAYVQLVTTGLPYKEIVKLRYEN